MNFDLATKVTIDLTVASGDTLDLLGAESSILTLQVINGSTITLTEGSDSGGAGATAVDPEFIIVGDGAGTKAANVVSYTAAGNAWVGYVGDQRYLTVTIANPAVDDTIGLVLGDLHRSPGV